MSFHRIDTSELSRALVIKLRHHGDVLLTTPVFSALKHEAPHCEIDALIYDETREMLEGHPAISRIHTIGRDWRNLGAFERMRREWLLFAALRARHYDLIVQLTDGWRGAWLARALRAKYSVAIFSPLKPPHHLWSKAFTHLAPLPPLGKRHTVETHLDALRALGIAPAQQCRRLTFEPGESARQSVKELLGFCALPRQRWIHIHPTSRWLFKTWSVAAYAEVISSLAEKGYQMIMTTGPANQELAMAAEILSRCRIPPLDLSGRLDLKQLGALIETVRLSICVDSMPMHLCAALGTPVVALFGPSSEQEWGPWQVPHRILASQHTCRPCRLDGCGGGKISECLTALSPDMVLTAVESLLDETV